MLVYAGIDEAGYGPMFGPLVIGRATVIVDDAEPTDDPPSIWQLLSPAICRKATDKKRRIPVNDSKKLYSPALGLGHLERGVLAFCAAADANAATTDELLALLAYDPPSRQPDQLWYTDSADHTPLPTTVDPGLLRIAQGRLIRALERAAMRIAPPATAVVFEDRFNRMVHATRSKARASWTFVAGHLLAVWNDFGEYEPIVVIDRQGGRTHYEELLCLLFPDAEVSLLEESPLRCRFRIADPRRAMRIAIQTEADAQHLPVALASMTAKYVRELWMQRFNRFWQSHLPDLKPTAGYFGDGRRFLHDIEPVITELAIERTTLVRAM